MAERSIAAVLKSVDLRGSGGSNPSLSAKNKRPREGESLLSDSRGRLFLQGPSWRRTRDGRGQSLSLRKNKQPREGESLLSDSRGRFFFVRAFLAKDQGWMQSIPLSPPKDDSRKNRISPSGGVLFFVQKKYIVHDISCIFCSSSAPRSATVICQPSGEVIPTSYKRHWPCFEQLIY